MTSAADTVRADRIRETLALTPSERIDLMSRLSEEGIAFLMSAQQITREEALRRVRASRRAGRTLSVSHEAE